MITESDHRQITAHHLQHMMEYAELRGVPRQQMLDLVPYQPKHFRDETATVTQEEFYNVLALIDEQLQDELIGIRAGFYLNMKSLGLIYRISLQTTTIEEAFFYLKSYLEGTFPVIEIKTDVVKRAVKLRLNIDNKRKLLNRFILENVLTVVAREIKHMAGKKTKIKLFSPFRNPDYPESWSHGKYFGLQFGPTILQAALKDKGRLHLDILIPEYLKLIEALKTEKSFESKVKIAALNLAEPELPELKAVADSFNLTPRTLQRRLQEERTTFRRITDDLKRTISDMLLRHKKFSIADISFVLGYSEPAAFIHSFKKWHGSSPKKVRNTLYQ